MSRMWEITKFIVIAQLAIHLMAGLNVFGVIQYTEIQGGATDYTSGTLESTIDTQKQDVRTSFDSIVTLVFSGLNLIWTIIKAATAVYWMLVDTFHFNELLAGTIQAIMWVEYTWFIAQWLGGRSGRQIE